MFSIYVHIPFCLKKCPYCDFYSVAGTPDKIPQKAYAEAVCREIEQQAARYGMGGRKVDTIYFGGGTPSLFEPWALEAILNAVHKYFLVADDVEITVEANPETLKHLNTQTLKHLFNRLSIGIQTFNDYFLQKLGRIHSAETAINAVKQAQDAGFTNIGIDLMWGLPEQKIEDLELDLEKAVALSPQHISAYQLTTNNFTNLPDEDLAREMFLMVHDGLAAARYEHYEISNFAKISPFSPLYKRGVGEDFRCRHNLNYWHYGEWIGVGCSASSFISADNRLLRFTAAKDIDQYLRYDFSYEVEPIDQKTAMAEYCFLGLRTSDGIDLDGFKLRFGKDFDAFYPNLRKEWIQNDFAVTCKLGNLKTWKLTLSGWLISDELFTEFII